MVEDSLRRMTDLLVESAQPKRIILFGSRARGETREGSDFDIMVIEECVGDRIAEMVRLSRILRPLRIPFDLLVVSEEKFEYWRDTPGNIYFEASTGGKILYEAA